MTLGCPVCNFQYLIIPEVAGDAAIIVDPNDVISLAWKQFFECYKRSPTACQLNRQE